MLSNGDCVYYRSKIVGSEQRFSLAESFSLRFKSGDDSDRRAAFLEVCQRIHQDPSHYDEFW